MKDFLKKEPVLITEAILLLIIVIVIIFSLASRAFSIRKSMEANLPPERVQLIRNRISFNQQKLEAAKTQFVPDIDLFNIYNEMAFDHHMLGDLVPAKEFYLKAIKITRHDPAVWASLFSVYRNMYDYKAASSAVQKSLEINGNDWNLWRGYIEIEQFHLGADKNQLDSLYRQALLATNNSINIITVYAKFLAEKGDREGAIKYWKMALEKDPKNELFQKEITRLEGTL